MPNRHFAIEHHETPEAVIIMMAGALDWHAEERYNVEETCCQAIDRLVQEEGCRRLELNLIDLGFVDSEGLHILQMINSRARRGNVTYICHANDRLKRTIQRHDLKGILPTH